MDQVGVAAERQVRIDSIFERSQALLLELGRGSGTERRSVEVGQRRAAPERERLVQRLGSSSRLGRVARLCTERRKRLQVERARLELEYVPRRTGLKRCTVFPERLAQAGRHTPAAPSAPSPAACRPTARRSAARSARRGSPPAGAARAQPAACEAPARAGSRRALPRAARAAESEARSFQDPVWRPFGRNSAPPRMFAQSIRQEVEANDKDKAAAAPRSGTRDPRERHRAQLGIRRVERLEAVRGALSGEQRVGDEPDRRSRSLPADEHRHRRRSTGSAPRR